MLCGPGSDEGIVRAPQDPAEPAIASAAGGKLTLTAPGGEFPVNVHDFGYEVNGGVLTIWTRYDIEDFLLELK